MKRKLAFLLALVLVLAFSSSALAATFDQDTTGGGTTTVTYTVTSSYTITIPDAITAEAGTDTPAKTVSVNSGFLIENGQTLTINVASANVFKLKSAANDTINYTLSSDGNTTPALSSTNTKVLAVSAGATTGLTANLTFDIEDPTIAGTYTDTLTFTAAVA